MSDETPYRTNTTVRSSVSVYGQRSGLTAAQYLAQREVQESLQKSRLAYDAIFEKSRNDLAEYNAKPRGSPARLTAFNWTPRTRKVLPDYTPKEKFDAATETFEIHPSWQAAAEFVGAQRAREESLAHTARQQETCRAPSEKAAQCGVGEGGGRHDPQREGGDPQQIESSVGKGDPRETSPPSSGNDEDEWRVYLDGGELGPTDRPF